MTLKFWGLVRLLWFIVKLAAEDGLFQIFIVFVATNATVESYGNILFLGVFANSRVDEVVICQDHRDYGLAVVNIGLERNVTFIFGFPWCIHISMSGI